MNRQLIKISSALCAIMIFVMISATAAPTVANADSSVYLTVRQVFSNSSSSPTATFSYRLAPLDADIPMPSGSTAEGYSFQITGNESAVIGPMSYTREGIYRYELYQAIGTEAQGYIYDRRIYTIKIHVDESLNAYVIVLNANGTKADEIVFTNRYESGGGWTIPPTPIYPPVPPVTPITPVTPPDPIEETEVEIEDKDPPGSEAIELYPSYEIEIEDKQPPGEGEPGEKRPGIIGPKTGDESNTMLDIILFGAGGLLVIGAAITLIAGKKRDKARR